MPHPHILVCIDLEGTLTPEVWAFVAAKTGIDELKVTTREVPGFEALMAKRIEICNKNEISMSKLCSIVNEMEPLHGAKEMIDSLRSKYQVIILSDIVDQLGLLFMEKLGRPTFFANTLEVTDDKMVNTLMRLTDGKRKAIEAFRSLNFKTIAMGDAYNDSTMLQSADAGIWIHAPDNVLAEFPQFPSAKNYEDLLQKVDEAAAKL
eukprot:NODE_670_length_1234_cov_185.881857_g482_i0.p1 GENE.NODE_670_length_1234_cov_185.881857_g482_i0~~NODE_670_length_1234_cov_185.881857_g482_i0.p1  ORF type:complete len:206 (-),score=82.73 NODE_670_length_1234_cov_185.881857_g482_i0:519-1136(-)